MIARKDVRVPGRHALSMRYASLLFPLALAACQAPQPPVSTPPAVDLVEAKGLAQGACGSCHSVEPYGRSPNPASPEFAAIANRPGVSRETLLTWLRDAHNYPAEMDFWLEGGEADQLTAYILSLRRAGYEPPI